MWWLQVPVIAGLRFTTWLIFASPLVMLVFVFLARKDWYYRIFHYNFFYHNVIMNNGEPAVHPHRWKDVDGEGIKCKFSKNEGGVYCVEGAPNLKLHGRLDLYHFYNNPNPVYFTAGEVAEGKNLLGDKFVWTAQRILYHVEGKSMINLNRVYQMTMLQYVMIALIVVSVAVGLYSIYYDTQALEFLRKFAYYVSPEMFASTPPSPNGLIP